MSLGATSHRRGQRAGCDHERGPGGTTHLSISLPTDEAKILRRRAKRRREAVLRGLLVEPVRDDVMKLAGIALGEVRATTIDAIVAAFAVQRTGIVYTSDVGGFEALQSFFPALRAFGI